MEICDVCDNDANHTCGACGQMAYCSIACQSADWPEHMEFDCSTNHEDLIEHMGVKVLEPGYFMAVDKGVKMRAPKKKSKRKGRRKTKRGKRKKKKGTSEESENNSQKSLFERVLRI